MLKEEQKAAEEQKASEEIILKKFFKVIFKSKFEENYITDPKNICYKFIDNLTDTCHNSKDFKELLEDCFERINEYTDKSDKYPEGLPDFYLRSKVDGVPELAIEVKTLQRDYDRIANYNESFEIKDYELTIRDFELVIRLNPPGYIFPPPKKVIKLWNEFENELKNLKKGLEYIIDRMNIIEKKLEDENQDMYLKDLSYKNKKELMEIIDGLKKDERFTKGTDFTYTLSRFEINLRIDKEESSFKTSDNDKIGNVREIIKRDKRRFLEKCVENFLTDYFNEAVYENHYSSCIAKVRSQKQENKFIFTVYFIKTWESEDVNFHVEKVEEFIEESKKKI